MATEVTSASRSGTARGTEVPGHELLDAARRLTRWLVEDAYPLWWRKGADHLEGGYHERLLQSGAPLKVPRRARLHPRQMYAFSLADEFGQDGMTEPAIRHALDYFQRYYVRQDGFVRTLVSADGRILDDDVLLYDQAFALLGYAAAYDVFGDDSLRDRARSVLEQLQIGLANPVGGFYERLDAAGPLASNSHMHLLEAALAWLDLDHDGRWRRLAESLVELALARFLDASTGQIAEFFTADWRPASGPAGPIVEPGHQFEWAWLLLRWSAAAQDRRAHEAALRLIDVGEQRGVDAARNVAINSLSLDGSRLDDAARLWPQTERLKAACLAWQCTGKTDYRNIAGRAAASLEGYLRTATPGLWFDRMRADGSFVAEPAPASSFYHLVAAIAELSDVAHRPGSRRQTGAVENE